MLSIKRDRSKIKAFDYESLIDDFVRKNVKNQYLRIDKKIY